MEPTSENHIRLDKWLKIARIFKTRTQASHVCEGGHVKVNDAAAKPAKTIKAGDKLAVKYNNRYRELKVLDVAFKSISAKEALKLYHEERNQCLSDESADFLKLLKGPRKTKAFKYPGRPTKKERRSLDKIRGH